MDWDKVDAGILYPKTAVISTAKLEIICQKNRTVPVFMATKMAYSEAKTVCLTLGGDMPFDPVYSVNERYTIGDIDSCSNNFWIPVIQGAPVGQSLDKYQWIDDRITSNSSPAGKTKWATIEPNGGLLEQCVSTTKENDWFDSNCEAKKCSVCMIPMAQTFYLRGPDLFEHLYLLSLDLHWDNDHMLFEGQGFSKLIWYPLQTITELKSKRDHNISLVFDKNPFGILQWYKKGERMSTLHEWIFSNVS